MVVWITESAIRQCKYGYSQYSHLSPQYTARSNPVATLHHKPGPSLFAHWACDTVPLSDAVTGDVSRGTCPSRCCRTRAKCSAGLLPNATGAWTGPPVAVWRLGRARADCRAGECAACHAPEGQQRCGRGLSRTADDQPLRRGLGVPVVAFLSCSATSYWTRGRYDSPSRLRTMERCRRRSSIAAVTVVSSRISPEVPTGRSKVTTMLVSGSAG